MFHSFPFIIPFLPVKIPNGTYYLGQDLQLIDSAIVPLYPIVPNCYTLLSIILPETSHLSVLQGHLIFYSSGPLSVTKFLCCTWTNLNMHIPVHLMLTVLPQGLQYSSHLVRVWTLTYSLCLFQDYTTCTYLLLCSLSLRISHSNTLLNILSSWEYKVSPSQLQVSTPQVSRINSYSNS